MSEDLMVERPADWQVHVLGPDDLLPPTSRLDAMRQAQAFNAASLAVIEAEGDDPTMPLMWAVPERAEVQSLDQLSSPRRPLDDPQTFADGWAIPRPGSGLKS